MLTLLLLACTPEEEKSTPDTDPPVDSAAPDDSGADSAIDTDSAVDTDSASVDDTADSGADDSGTTDPDAEARAASCSSLATAAADFLSSLDSEQQAAVTFALDEANRTAWSNLPVPTVPRDGLPLGDMTEPQQALAWNLLGAALSSTGLAQALDIVRIDEWWATDQANDRLGAQYYTWAIYGTPTADGPWAFQLDGHHLVYNFTVLCPEVKMAPNLLGVQPTTGPRDSSIEGLQAMAPETRSAVVFMESLTGAQLAFAQASEVNDARLIAGPDSVDLYGEAAGISGADLAPDQQALLLSLIGAWIEDQDEPFSTRAAAVAEAEIADTWLVWHGPVAGAGGYYYRLRSPSLYVELDWEGADHIHAVFRDPDDDYGLDLLASHRARFH